MLISDTHGRMDSVNVLAEKTGAEYCFHLGDLCTYTRESVDLFPADMLYKQLKHSPLCTGQELAACADDPERLRQLVKKYRTYGNFEEYLSGARHFNIPVYAVTGNNDDAALEKQLLKKPPRNLLFLNEKKQVFLENFMICGIGGGFYEFFEDGSTFQGCCFHPEQIEELQKNASLTDPETPRILLMHVPPSENELLIRLIRSIKPVLTLCGHTHHWGEAVIDGRFPVLNLTKSTAGYAVLELNGKNWNCRKYELK